MKNVPLKLRISDKAEQDLEARIEYLQNEGSSSAAGHFLEAVARSMESLRVTPGIGKAMRLRSRPPLEFRWISVARPFHRWLLVSTVSGTGVRIERITHTAQDIRRFVP